MRGAFFHFAGECLVVRLPRALVLKNWRLGAFYKLLQLCFLALCVFYSWYSWFFLQPHTVKPWGISVLQSEGWGNGNHTPPAYCHHLEDYAHYQGSANHKYDYEPTACKVLPAEDAAVTAANSKELFIATFVDEMVLWEGTGTECRDAQEACDKKKSIYGGTAGRSRCSCTLHEQFLVQNPEEQHIRLVYGYEIDFSDGQRKELSRGGILAAANTVGPPHKMKEQPSDLVTVFLGPDGKACEFGNKSEWKHSDSVGGITGTLRELLDCAGLTLDSNPADLFPGIVAGSSHLRTTGLRLELHLHLEQKLFGKTSVFIRVVAVPVTSTMESSESMLPNFLTTTASATTRRSRRAHGVAISMPSLTGRIYTFNWFHVLRGIIDVTVVLQIPRIVVYFVAMNLLGLTSEVYRSTALTKLNVFNKLHSSVAQLMLAEVAFRGLVRNWHGKVTDIAGLTPKMLHGRLLDIFQDQRSCGLLQVSELEHMTKVIFMAMDKDGSGMINCGEFVQACTEESDVNIDRLAQYFDEDRKVCACRRLLDDTYDIKSASRKAAGRICFNSDESVPDYDMEATGSSTVEQNTSPQNILSPDDFANLEQRMADLELHCERALAALRTSITASPQGPTSKGKFPNPLSVCADSEACPAVSPRTSSTLSIDGCRDGAEQTVQAMPPARGSGQLNLADALPPIRDNPGRRWRRQPALPMLPAEMEVDDVDLVRKLPPTSSPSMVSIAQEPPMPCLSDAPTVASLAHEPQVLCSGNAHPSEVSLAHAPQVLRSGDAHPSGVSLAHVPQVLCSGDAPSVASLAQEPPVPCLGDAFQAPTRQPSGCLNGADWATPPLPPLPPVFVKRVYSMTTQRSRCHVMGEVVAKE